ncbi:hypothetical protein V8C40DRAFT_256958 [Trichoderma camerunense]
MAAAQLMSGTEEERKRIEWWASIRLVCFHTAFALLPNTEAVGWAILPPPYMLSYGTLPVWLLSLPAFSSH